jgi:hypothetical protein
MDFGLAEPGNAGFSFLGSGAEEASFGENRKNLFPIFSFPTQFENRH